MSPLLYAIILAPLLESIRHDREIKGIDVPGGGEQKSKAFADDTMMLKTKDGSIIKTYENLRTLERLVATRLTSTKRAS